MINEILQPLLDQKIIIQEDGTSQTRINNTGRFGFYVERLFDISPNNSQLPDHTVIGEIKTVQIKGKNLSSCSIGTISEANWQSIVSGSARTWETSPPFAKMKQTLFVFYAKDCSGPEPVYEIKRYVSIDFSKIGDAIKNELEEDYQAIRNRMINSRGYGTCDFSWLGNIYLSAGIKGDSCYVYPSFSFKPRLMKAIYDVATKSS
jgi:hypothetical protein